MTDLERTRRIWVEPELPPKGVKVIRVPNKVPQALMASRETEEMVPAAFRYVTAYLEVFDEELPAYWEMGGDAKVAFAERIVLENAQRVAEAVGASFPRGFEGRPGTDRMPWVG